VPTREQELEWLQDSLPNEQVHVRSLVEDVLALVSSMAHASRVRLHCTYADDLPHPVAKLTSIRQALLTILTGIIRSIPDGQISVRTQAQDSEVHILIEPKGPTFASDQAESGFEGLETARQLVELSGGSFEVLVSEKESGSLTLRIALPAREQVPVLVIDDNADTLHLLRRYLANSRYHFVGTSDPHHVVQLAEDLSPQIIVLDVMLPGIDGWELLGRLREHPQTYQVPIIVCTILPQEQLALNVGAADFIRKPVSRRAFLSALDRQLALTSTKRP
jgi:CheY-like chemotaxis protein